MSVDHVAIRDFFFADSAKPSIYQRRKGEKLYGSFNRMRIVWPKPDRHLTLLTQYRSNMGMFTFRDYSIYSIVLELGNHPGMKEVIRGSLIYRDRKSLKRLRRHPVVAMLRAWGFDLR